MEDDGELLHIEINSSDEATAALKPPRDHQSVENFAQQKASWKPKTEDGDFWKTLVLPSENPSKPESQTILYAIEELYFLGLYDDAKELTSSALKGQLQDELRATLEKYLARCKVKLATLMPSTAGPNSFTVASST